MFGPNARIQQDTYGVLMHSVRVKNLDLKNEEPKWKRLGN